ncbi:hypothetical protein [Nocardia sp. NPDC127526]|uniref:hypothetical protein n=1 Tax=Nocardia sp. NPDC127526 TaxID=3345393 RepID=UPI0036349544
MRAISGFALGERVGGEDDRRLPRSRLYWRLQDTGIWVPGHLIEAQYCCDAGFLLVTSDDCPFEESSHLLLLSPRFRRRARRELRLPYESFLLHETLPLDNDRLRVEYYGGPLLILVPRRHWYGYSLGVRLAPVGGAGRYPRTAWAAGALLRLWTVPWIQYLVVGIVVSCPCGPLLICELCRWLYDLCGAMLGVCGW